MPTPRHRSVQAVFQRGEWAETTWREGLDLELTDWKTDALCRDVEDPDIFFGGADGTYGKVGHNNLVHIRELCAECPVRRECLLAGLHEYYGIWGGTTAEERRRMRALRKSVDWLLS